MCPELQLQLEDEGMVEASPWEEPFAREILVSTELADEIATQRALGAGSRRSSAGKMVAVLAEVELPAEVERSKVSDERSALRWLRGSKQKADEAEHVLTPLQRELINQIRGGKSLTEIADARGVSKVTASVMIRRAMVRLLLELDPSLKRTLRTRLGRAQPRVDRDARRDPQARDAFELDDGRCLVVSRQVGGDILFRWRLEGGSMRPWRRAEERLSRADFLRLVADAVKTSNLVDRIRAGMYPWERRAAAYELLFDWGAKPVWLSFASRERAEVEEEPPHRGALILAELRPEANTALDPPPEPTDAKSGTSHTGKRDMSQSEAGQVTPGAVTCHDDETRQDESGKSFSLAGARDPSATAPAPTATPATTSRSKPSSRDPRRDPRGGDVFRLATGQQLRVRERQRERVVFTPGCGDVERPWSRRTDSVSVEAFRLLVATAVAAETRLQQRERMRR